MDAIKLDVQAHILKAKIGNRLNVFSGGMRQSNDVEHNGLDLSLFSVPGKLVQVRDTSESAIYVHSNGPRHIKAKIDNRLNVFSGGMRQSNDVEHNGLDLGLFPVFGKLVQVRDTSESAIYIHSNSPRHIPSKAKTLSINSRLGSFTLEKNICSIENNI
jgi:hypothetical protein